MLLFTVILVIIKQGKAIWFSFEHNLKYLHLKFSTVFKLNMIYFAQVNVCVDSQQILNSDVPKFRLASRYGVIM